MPFTTSTASLSWVSISLLNLQKKAALVAMYTKGTGDMGMVEDVDRTIADNLILFLAPLVPAGLPGFA